MSGLRPNCNKCGMFIAGVSDEEKGELSNLMGMELKSLPVRYMGVPLISPRLRAVDCEGIKSKMLKSAKLDCKKTYAGRIQLVIFVLHGTKPTGVAFLCFLRMFLRRLMRF